MATFNNKMCVAKFNPAKNQVSLEMCEFKDASCIDRMGVVGGKVAELIFMAVQLACLVNSKCMSLQDANNKLSLEATKKPEKTEKTVVAVKLVSTVKKAAVAAVKSWKEQTHAERMADIATNDSAFPIKLAA